ncbi:hypothetical protein ACA910_018693 [Epithemia clementina (nom. ined.)]
MYWNFSLLSDDAITRHNTSRLAVALSLFAGNLFSSVVVNDDYQEHGNGQGCRYDGHCAIGMTCGVPLWKNSTPQGAHEEQETDDGLPPGQCLDFPILPNQKSPNDKDNDEFLKTCQQACQVELEMDEHFFHEAWPHILAGSARTTASVSRPKGCVIDYVRQDDNVEHWKELHANDEAAHKGEPTASILAWEKTRFRHLIRVDPVISAANSNSSNSNSSSNKTTTSESNATNTLFMDEPQQVWRAYCIAPCQTNNDCQTESTKYILDDSNRPWQCVEGACQRNPHYWENFNELLVADAPNTSVTLQQQQQQQQRKPRPGKIVFVTGATKKFFPGLKNLVASIRYWAPNNSVVVYNLGGLDQYAGEIQGWKNVIAMEWFDEGIPKEYPPHVHAGKKYAWKPIAIEQALKKYGMIFWLDAGSTLTAPVEPIENIVKRNGIFLVHGQDVDMKRKSHNATYKWYGIDKDTFPNNRPHFGGGTQASLYPSRFVEPIIERNAACARDENCIAPKGSTLGNHRYDQTSISICAYHPHVRAPHHTEFLAASFKQLNKYLTDPSYQIIYTARGGCRNCYIHEYRNYIEKGITPVDWTKIDLEKRRMELKNIQRPKHPPRITMDPYLDISLPAPTFRIKLHGNEGKMPPVKKGNTTSEVLLLLGPPQGNESLSLTTSSAIAVDSRNKVLQNKAHRVQMPRQSGSSQKQVDPNGSAAKKRILAMTSNKPKTSKRRIDQKRGKIRKRLVRVSQHT